MTLKKINDFLGVFGLVMLIGLLTDENNRVYHGKTEITIIRKKNIQKKEMLKNPDEV